MRKKVCTLAESAEGLNKGDAALVQSAVLCLCKFAAGELRETVETVEVTEATVSESLCEKHLPLLLTILRDSPDQVVRANIIISIGDLAFRFPNVVEPFTAQVYRPLRDPVATVRKSTLMVLTHLALNDMIKVRGEVAEIATRLLDEDERIQDLAKLFFAELSKRGSNPIYNLLPDVLSSLSRERSSEQFKQIAKYLVEFVDKDKQCESVVDKVCNRIFALLGECMRGRDE